MSKDRPNKLRILGIAPSTRGFGFAVFEGQETLVDWGAKSAEGDKNVKCIAGVEKMIVRYRPDILVLRDLHNNIHRPARIKELSQQIGHLGDTIKVVFLSDAKIKQRFFANGQGTRHAIAEILAQKFPEELGSILQPKRRLWMSEDRNMDIFDAVALALASV